MTDGDEFDDLRNSLDSAFREFFASLPLQRRIKEPPFEPMPTCKECHGTGWAQKEVRCGGEGGCNPPCAAVDFHDRTDSNGDTMAEVICFPLYRRQKLVRRLRQAKTDNEFRHALKRTAESLARIGVLSRP
jgi:hypothetical protein